MAGTALDGNCCAIHLHRCPDAAEEKTRTSICAKAGVTFTHALCFFTCTCCVLSCIYITLMVQKMSHCAADCRTGLVTVADWNHNGIRSQDEQGNIDSKATDTGYHGDPVSPVRHVRATADEKCPEGEDCRNKGKECRGKKCKGKGKGKGKGRKGKGKKRSKSRPVKAAHYISHQDLSAYRFDRYDDVATTDGCVYVRRMKGFFCGNRTFRTNTTSSTLHVFREAQWVRNETAPFDLLEHGIFRARDSGIYLVYAQVLLRDRADMGVINVIQRRLSGYDKELQRMSCYHTLHGDSQQFRTCGTVGVFSMEKHDTLELQNYYADVHIDLTKSVTYFGAVFLGPAS